MRNGLICLALLLCIGAGLTAQYIYNPNSTPNVGGANSWPFGSYPEWRYQFIISNTVMGNAPIKIIDIAFAPSSTRTYTATQFQMRMGHTTFTQYTPYDNNPNVDYQTILGPCPTIVYDGPLSWPCTSAQWSDIGLQRSFAYDGKRNIAVDIRFMGGSAGVTTYTDSSINRAYVSTQRTPNPYNDPKWYVPTYGEAMGMRHRLTVDKNCFLLASDTVQLGQVAYMNIYNGPPGDLYQMAASLGQTPLPLGPCTIFLTPDPVFLSSILVGPPVFYYYAGTLSAAGGAGAKLVIPNIKALVGVCVYHAGVAYNKGGIICCTNTDGTQIIP